MAAAVKSKPHKKYFLYIDILGFSDLVMGQGRVRDLYERFDDLNAHRHPSFQAIVFSDTMLVFNKDDLEWDDNDKTALVTRLCEFAGDLFYRLVSQDIHFRAYICCGEFEHSKMKHIDAFFGPALIRAYTREREIQCTGLFIDNDLVPYLGWFDSSQYDAHSHFVHIMLTLDNISYDQKDYPIDWNLIGPVGNDVWASYDITYLKNIHAHMNDMNKPPRVRVKYLSAWQMLQVRHRSLLDVLERNQFDPKAICDMDWAPVFARIGTDKGFFE